jgi:hypothetical protein
MLKRLRHSGLFQASIWGPRSVSPADARLAGMLRIVLPAFDVFGIIFGITGGLGTIPALRDVFTGTYAAWWGGIFAVVCLVCLVGVAFPQRLWRVELAGKAFLVMMLLIYTGAVFWAGATAGDLGRAAVGFAIIMMTCLPIWRTFDIPRERQVHGWK